MDFDLTTYFIIGFTALAIGISKSGVKGLGILAVAVMAMVLPARQGVGILLPILAMGDVFAVCHYRGHARWDLLKRLAPGVLIGMACAAWILHSINDAQLRPLLGWIILGLLALEMLRKPMRWDKMQDQRIFSQVIALLSGFSSTVGNVAGPIVNTYFLTHRLGKNAFVASAAWFFLILNLTKIPIFMSVNMLDTSTLLFTLWFIPVVGLGAWIGIKTLPYVPQEVFNWIIRVLTAFAGLKLI